MREAAARTVESSLLLSDFPRDIATVRDAVRRIRALPVPAGDTLSTGGEDNHSVIGNSPTTATGGWNSDMEKAPKDGTHILIAVKLHHMPEAISGSAYYRAEVEGRHQGAWWWAGEGPGDYHADPIPAAPYAWMPIPLPPPFGVQP